MAGGPDGRAIGVLGGAFNPPHIGHLLLAQEAVARLGLREAVLVPTGEAPHKVIEADPGREARLEMTRRAVAGDEGLSVSAFEVEAADRGEGPSYTVRTLEAMREERSDELVLLLGADTAASLGSWYEPERIVTLARVGVAPRPGIEQGEVDAALERLGGAPAEPVEMPAVGVSSTEVRERVAAGLPIRHLVPDPVIALIGERGLYA